MIILQPNMIFQDLPRLPVQDSLSYAGKTLLSYAGKTLVSSQDHPLNDKITPYGVPLLLKCSFQKNTSISFMWYAIFGICLL